MKPIFMMIAVVVLAALGVAGCDANGGCSVKAICGSPDEDVVADTAPDSGPSCLECQAMYPYTPSACTAVCHHSSKDVFTTPDDGGGYTDATIEPDATEEVDVGPTVNPCDKDDFRFLPEGYHPLFNNGVITYSHTTYMTPTPEGDECCVTFSGKGSMFKLKLCGNKLPLEQACDGSTCILDGTPLYPIQRVDDGPAGFTEKKFIPVSEG